MTYNKLNNITGWAVFVIALLVYLLTVAPTASFWDCGEFIACANELQVPHPPGAPFFLILGRVFAIFSFGDGDSVAYLVNLLSVFASAFTALFTFWTVTILAKKITDKNEEEASFTRNIAIMAAGVVGALACTFADSVWFNAVEAEVYALSSFFTAAVVWLMFKWEARADQPHNLRWLVLIAFLMGISIGTHLLNLLTIPALALIYYWRKYEFSWGGLIATLVVSVFILGAIQIGLTQTTVEMAFGMEQALVGTESVEAGSLGEPDVTGMGLPMGTGVILFLFLMCGFLVSTLWVTQKKDRMDFKRTSLNNKIQLGLLAPVFGLLYGIQYGINNLMGKRVAVSGDIMQQIGHYMRVNRVSINTITLSIVVLLIGYSSYAMIVIRANADGLPINENDPSNASSVLSYIKREQYGDRPLFRGVRYNNLNRYETKRVRKNYINLREPRPIADGAYTLNDNRPITVKNGVVSGIKLEGDDILKTKLDDGTKVTINPKNMRIGKVESRYLYDGYRQDIEYDSDAKVFFPRMHSGSHYRSGAYGYENYVKNKGADPNSPYDDQPTMSEDLKFFWDYQVRHMYWRYFMWNFAGREGDVQDQSWEAGLGGSGDMPEDMASHPGKNHYFFLPLLLGLFGMVYQYISNYKDATTILFLFFFTGLAIILYLNQTPSQPRERDYSYAGSFQTFAIWIGLGVIGLYELLKPYLKKNTAYLAGGFGLLAPLLMGFQNWDDHNRSARYVAPDSAYNLLNSCKKNAILFTNGDNDTFPLWYIQEVEGVRTDVRVVNLSLLNTDWYINQMKEQQNESPPLPISIPQIEYVGEKRAFQNFPKTKTIYLNVNRDSVLSNGTVPTVLKDSIQSPMPWTIKARGGGGRTYLLKQDWLIMDILINNANNGWGRPVYFSSTIPPQSYMNLQPNFKVEGLAYRVTPASLAKPVVYTDPYRQGILDKDICYDLIMNKFKYTGLDNDNLYLDDHIRRTIIGNLRSTIFRTANAFVDEVESLEQINSQLETQLKLGGDTLPNAASKRNQIEANKGLIDEYRKKGIEVLDMAQKRISVKAVRPGPIYNMFSGQAYKRLGQEARAQDYYQRVIAEVRAYLDYYGPDYRDFPDYDRYISALRYVLQEFQQMQKWIEAADIAALMFRYTGDASFQQMEQSFRQMGGQTGGTDGAPGTPSIGGPNSPGPTPNQPNPNPGNTPNQPTPEENNNPNNGN